MSLLDSVIDDAREKFDLGEKAEALMSAVLSLMTDPAQGGFEGFVSRFRSAGLGSLADSWITTGDNAPISKLQLESALGAEAVVSIAAQTGLERETTLAATAYMLPPTVDILTPDGEIPAERDLLSRIGRYLNGADDRAADGAWPGGFADRLDAGTADDSGTLVDEFENPVLNWLLPLVLLGLLVTVGFWFCGTSAPLDTGAEGSSANISKTKAETSAANR